MAGRYPVKDRAFTPGRFDDPPVLVQVLADDGLNYKVREVATGREYDVRQLWSVEKGLDSLKKRSDGAMERANKAAEDAERMAIEYSDALKRVHGQA